MKVLINKTGITVRAIKELVKDLPEVDENGDDYELWIENSENRGLSSVARSVMQLNRGDIIVSVWV